MTGLTDSEIVANVPLTINTDIRNENGQFRAFIWVELEYSWQSSLEVEKVLSAWNIDEARREVNAIKKQLIKRLQEATNEPK